MYGLRMVRVWSVHGLLVYPVRTGLDSNPCAVDCAACARSGVLCWLLSGVLKEAIGVLRANLTLTYCTLPFCLFYLFNCCLVCLRR